MGNLWNKIGNITFKPCISPFVNNNMLLLFLLFFLPFSYIYHSTSEVVGKKTKQGKMNDSFKECKKKLKDTAKLFIQTMK